MPLREFIFIEFSGAIIESLRLVYSKDMVYNLKDAREYAKKHDWTINCPKPVVSFRRNNLRLYEYVLIVLLTKSWGATSLWYVVICSLWLGELISCQRIKYMKHDSPSSWSRSSSSNLKRDGLFELLHTLHVLVYWTGAIAIVISKYRIIFQRW